jgi:hypothetical protein
LQLGGQNFLNLGSLCESRVKVLNSSVQIRVEMALHPTRSLVISHVPPLCTTIVQRAQKIFSTVKIFFARS